MRRESELEKNVFKTTAREKINFFLVPGGMTFELRRAVRESGERGLKPYVAYFFTICLDALKLGVIASTPYFLYTSLAN